MVQVGLNDLGASAPLSVQREAVRILETLISGSDTEPLPDGTTRFSFECTREFFDRLTLWASIAHVVGGAECGVAGASPGLGDVHDAEGAAVAVAEGQDNVIAPVDLLHTHAVRTGAREALALLMADVEPGALPELSPRPLAEQMVLRGDGRGEVSASQSGPIPPLAAAV